VKRLRVVAEKGIENGKNGATKPNGTTSSENDHPAA
jgi:hypothetical protein